MKLAIIRCLQTEDDCPGTTCFKVIYNKKLAFKDIEDDIEIVGVNTCGGCPGKKAVFRAKEMVRRGADTIAFASCITKGSPIGFPCPHANTIKERVESKVGKQIRIIDYTH
ncbi:CGGC domain-containing protein [Haloplasma contractile]|uniref:Metal-binding protein-like protein n=1 Tax=Haloplasma contractile SSD-17B TaxID=1033810 RepID=F7Q0D7_9MOLU|nr:CGGC domain-containing protein [Haloplasma contractile]ERJ12717.1 Metal-binding protein-like protein [Haloplasma contractile SSD-17B]